MIEMKKVLIIILVTVSLKGFAQVSPGLKEPEADKRVETLSIVFRLAGNNEYNSTQFKFYTDRIENHFAPYKNHKLILFAKKMREENGVSYDAVMDMAVHLDNKFNPRSEFTDAIPDPRWGKGNAKKFVNLLKKFYRDARCDEFFKSNELLYKDIAAKYLPVYKNLDLNWYTSFYGKEPSEKFIIVIGMGNGNGNYGVSFDNPKGVREVYSILGTGSCDYLPIVIHEFNHSFVNYLLDKNREEFRSNGEKIFSTVNKVMKRQAYGSWETMLNEALVRASVIKYMKDHNSDKSLVESKIDEELQNGFLWIRGLVKELDNYDAHREIYPTLESYMPKLAEAYGIYADIITLSRNDVELNAYAP
jgi:hypothetical protein